MSTLRRVLAGIFILFATFNFALGTSVQAAAMVGPAWATKVVLYNASNADTCVIVTLGKGSGTNAAIQQGCPQQIQAIKYLDLTSGTVPLPLVTFTDSSIGWFILQRGHQVQLISQGVDPYSKIPTYCLQGVNIGFGGLGAAICPQSPSQAPITTPGPKFNQVQNIYPPNGSCGAEVTFNKPSLAGNVGQAPAQEACDLTCVNGASWILNMQLTPPAAGPFWNFSAGPKGGGTVYYKTTVSSQNSWVKINSSGTAPPYTILPGGCDDNCVDPRTGLARPGVFPYGCSTCNTFPDPKPGCPLAPSGGTHPGQFCAVSNGLPQNSGCQFNRASLTNQNVFNPNGALALGKFGGTAQINFLGPATPPANCP